MRVALAVLSGVFLLGAAPASRDGDAAAEGPAAGAVVAQAPVRAPQASGRPAAGTPIVAAGRAASVAPAPTTPAPAARSGDSAPRFAWPRLRVLEHVESSEIVEAGGVPVALRALRVKEGPAELVQRLADAFRDGGLYVPPGREQPQFASGAAMLTAVDAQRRITYTAIIQPHEDGTTTLYLGEANHALRREPIAAGDFAPLPPGASQVLRVGGESTRTLAFHVPLSARDVDAFYARALAQHGWKRAEGEADVYTRPGEELRVVREPGAGGQLAVVLIHRGQVPAPPGVP
ncbi:hypothetical protein [Pyxidicoccus xibeiensis]|uniref:hypothetical protein n=1 Tax=Pyxidicoccus xibeiensis TaxID=2906759 RepID=UPI0020A82A9B|nr:hypothetical protein [Pyxidicoccus xibeiensis]MCP3136103.1 hypothetical protein [Pyxidicoccus xibeiensis]